MGTENAKPTGATSATDVIGLYEDAAAPQRPTFAGERCTLCGALAAHKIGEELTPDPLDPFSAIHPLTATVCADCFRRIFCPYLSKGARPDPQYVMLARLAWLELSGAHGSEDAIRSVATRIQSVVEAGAVREATAVAERDEARAWVKRLTSQECTLTCVYCGHAYPPGAPDHGSEVLTEHIKKCEKHPMREALDALDRLETVIDEEFGLQPVAESPEDLVGSLERLLSERRDRGAKT